MNLFILPLIYRQHTLVTQMGYLKLRHYIFKTLSAGLSDSLKYHGTHHTRDVLNVCNQYIKRYHVSAKDAGLLRAGALMHDFGFIYTYKNHEEKGVEMAREILPEFGYSKKDLDVIEGLIMATKVPQTPKTFLEEIICDADLDYLGRPDFDPISESLFEELNINGRPLNRHEWNTLQVNFLSSHHYHTTWARKYRAPNKAKRLQKLKTEIEGS